jgi:hypothetical protein
MVQVNIVHKDGKFNNLCSTFVGWVIAINVLLNLTSYENFQIVARTFVGGWFIHDGHIVQEGQGGDTAGF